MVQSRKTFIATVCLVLLSNLGSDAQGQVVFTNLVSFNGTNGATPVATLVFGPDGNFYGTTSQGGAFNHGTVFKMTPDGVLTTLASFDGTNGAWPQFPLLVGRDGNFYGATSQGGTYTGQSGSGYGTLFRMTPDGRLTSLMSFDGTNGGGSHNFALVQADDGSFFGTAQSGGPYKDRWGSSFGTFFRLTPDGVLTNVFFFNGTNGAEPWAGLVQGTDGNFYGTTMAGGAYTHQSAFGIELGFGTFFRVSQSGELTTLYSFDGTNGNAPMRELAAAPDGGFYGITYGYGPGNPNAPGTVYRITTNGVLTTLASFGTENVLLRGLTLGTDGNLYGMSGTSGAFNKGFIYQVTPDGTLTRLLSFDGVSGYNPFGGLVQGPDGSFYGATMVGGAYGSGNIFKFSVPSCSTPKIQTAKVSGETFTLSWTALPGRSYQVQFKSDWQAGSWSNLCPSMLTTNPTMTVSDSATSNALRMYRIVLLP